VIYANASYMAQAGAVPGYANITANVQSFGCCSFCVKLLMLLVRLILPEVGPSGIQPVINFVLANSEGVDGVSFRNSGFKI